MTKTQYPIKLDNIGLLFRKWDISCPQCGGDLEASMNRLYLNVGIYCKGPCSLVFEVPLHKADTEFFHKLESLCSDQKALSNHFYEDEDEGKIPNQSR